tara:strand:+ start:117 stop:317 length:201 start_codon:yes stop_codon:yes gene_type:complete
MAKGFEDSSINNRVKVKIKSKKLGNERMISWSPWPPANFQTKYPAFPLVMTVILLALSQWYISIAR